MSLEAGTLLGPYRVLAPLGAGGMGEVYRARDTKLDRDIALKILPPDVASAETLRRFEKEARAASSLNHPNIVAIYDVGRHESIAYIAMELVEGQTLRSAMTEPMPMKEALRVVAKVADVLASAHERGVIHRDLKPENVMISRDGYIKLLDFGLAKVRTVFASGDKTEPQTTAGHVFGTTSYMSPEQAAGRVIDFRSDQFSLGVILYEMVTGRRPFDRATGAETLAAVIRDEPPAIDVMDDALRADLQQVIRRCLAKAPNDRYASTRDLAHDLRELRNRLTLGSASGRAPRAIRFEMPHLRVVGTVTAILFVAVLAILLFQRHPVRPAGESMKALAILPFRDLSAKGDGQLFSDGITEMISARIAQANGLRVIAPFDDPARRHGADAVVKGSVQRVGEQLRVSFEVLDASTGNRIGGDMVTAPSSEVFTLEDYVADGVLQALKLSRTRRAVQAASNALSGPDQRKYIEAVGLLQRFNEAESLDRAIESLQSLLGNARDVAMVNSALGQALLRKYSFTKKRELLDEASIYAERAVQLDQGDVDAHITVGELRRISGKLPEAAAAFQRALALRPDSVYARLGLADTKDAMGRAAEADRLFREAESLDPTAPDVYGRYGFFCYRRGRYEDAVRLFTKQTELLPNAPRAFANLGAARMALANYGGAMEAYQRSLAIHPSGAAYSNLGTCQFILGRYADAAASYEKATALTPDNFEVWGNLGDAYRWAPGARAKSIEPYDRAIALARQALAINPQDAKTRAVAAAYMAKKGDLASAKGELKLALNTDPTNAVVWYQAAVIDAIRGDRESAVTWLGRAIESGRPRDEAARDPEFAGLRNDPRFRAAIAVARQKS